MSYMIIEDIQQMRKEKSERSFEAFVEFYFKHYQKKESSTFHSELCEMLQSATHTRDSHLVIAAPRGYAKSSYISCFYVLWSLCFHREKFILLVSDTEDQATRLLSAIKHELMYNQLLKEDFPEVCKGTQKSKLFCWNEHEIITGNGIRVEVLSVEQKMRGIRYREHRPTLIILDDIENDRAVQNPDRRADLEDWFTKVVLKAGDNGTNFIMIGTVMHFDSLIAKLLVPNEYPGWLKKKYRAILSDSNRPDLWDLWVNVLRTNEEYNGLYGEQGADLFFQDNKGEMLQDTAVLWPDKESYYDLMKTKASEKTQSFYSEKLNEPLDPKGAVFRIDEMCFWNDKFHDPTELLQSDEFDIIGACDPSVGKRSDRGDYSAIVTLARHRKTGVVYVLSADIARRSRPSLIKALLSHIESYKYKSFYIESIQFQDWIVDELRKLCTEKNIHTPIKGMDNRGSKRDRIESLEYYVKIATIQFNKRDQLLIEQLLQFPKAAHDDGPDALEMAWRATKECISRVTFEILSGGDDDNYTVDEDEQEDIRDKYGRDVNHREYGHLSPFEDA